MWGRCDSEKIIEALSVAYDVEERHYQNRALIESCLELLEEHGGTAVRQEEVALAICFHNLIYHSRRKYNEERPAAKAVELLRGDKGKLWMHPCSRQIAGSYRVLSLPLSGK